MFLFTGQLNIRFNYYLPFLTFMLKRSMIFIDAGNLFSGYRTYCRRNNLMSDKERGSKLINYRKFLLSVSENTDLIRSYYYDAVPQPLGKKQAFFDMLRNLEITIVTKPLKFKTIICKYCKKRDINIPHQKGVDVLLVTDMMSLAFEDA